MGQTLRVQEGCPRILLRREVCELIFVHAREGYPQEVCGVLLGPIIDPPTHREATLAVRARNLQAADSNDRYLLDPSDLARASTLGRELGLEVLGFYHSHPDHPAIPSRIDLEHSSPWGGYSYPIVSVVQGEVAEFRSWSREGDGWNEETIEGG